MKSITATEVDERIKNYRGPIPGDALVNYILDGILELALMNTNKFFKDRRDAVRYANALLKRSKPDLPLTITIKPLKSGACSVQTATGTSSEDIPTL